MVLAVGDAREIPLADESVQCCITSPPYWGLRDYGLNGRGIGLEASAEEYVAQVVAVFRQVRRVLRRDGTVWLNLGDSYTSGNRVDRDPALVSRTSGLVNRSAGMRRARTPDGLKPKDMVGIPWRVAFALQADGWWLRSDVIWHKPSVMPESVTDRPTREHEYVFLLAKSKRYYYDAEAVREPNSSPAQAEHNRRYARAYDNAERIAGGQPGNVNSAGIHSRPGPGGRNKRSVWTITAQPYKGAHFATFPVKLVEPMVLAGSAQGDVVLDPFGGTMTVGEVCAKHGRRFVGLDLKPEYVEMGRERCATVQTAYAL